ncbi:zinc finger protein 256-like isoform X2 [Talpa occidentalis]|uniref:zinc finger protein 256-like isoform X2 n=1 Tax=Talpa occidentalis TaxID=50954 RepID=UPI00188FE78A|nr:zinc finger protein 256-like isoform X2 [Talpa occidentalis]
MVVKIDVTFEDVAVYFSWEEWGLLDEPERRLYHLVMLENLALISSLGCCCGAENAETPFQPNVSIKVSQSRTPRAAPSSRKPHPRETCVPVLMDIFSLPELPGAHPSQDVFGCGACMEQLFLSANLQKQHMGEKSFTSSEDKASSVKRFSFHVSGTPVTWEGAGKGFLATSEHVQQQTPRAGQGPSAVTQCGAASRRRESHVSGSECRIAFRSRHALDRRRAVRAGGQCSVCGEGGKTFRSRSSLAAPRRGHAEESLRGCGDSGRSSGRSCAPGKPGSVPGGEGGAASAGFPFAKTPPAFPAFAPETAPGEAVPGAPSAQGPWAVAPSLLLGKGGCPPGREMWSVPSVGNPFGHVPVSLHTGELTLEKSLTSVKNVGNFSRPSPACVLLRAFTLRPGPARAPSAGGLHI